MLHTGTGTRRLAGKSWVPKPPPRPYFSREERRCSNHFFSGTGHMAGDGVNATEEAAASFLTEVDASLGRVLH